MRERTRMYLMETEAVKKLLCEVEVGGFATVNSDNSPYVVPVHFVLYDKKIYIHGSLYGQKIDNIKKNAKTSLTVYKMHEIVINDDIDSCNVNTKYESAIVEGEAKLVEDEIEKVFALSKIISKYTPQLDASKLSSDMVKNVAVVAIEIEKITGKYY